MTMAKSSENKEPVEKSPAKQSPVEQSSVVPSPPEPKATPPEDLRFSAKASAEPFEIAVLALQNLTLFPETVVPLGIGRPRSVAAVEAALSSPEKLLVCITTRQQFFRA